MERYTETIDTLMRSIHLDETLCSHILDIIPKLVEARGGIGLRVYTGILRGVIPTGTAAHGQRQSQRYTHIRYGAK